VHRQLKDPLKQGIKRGLVDGGMLGFSQLIMLSAYGFVFWYGGHKVLRGEVAFQRMLRSLMAVMMAAQGVGQTSSFLGDTAAAEAAAARIFAIIDRQPVIDSGAVSGARPGSLTGR
jgi:ATP-binding cassette, subfamily B (MDR/TAP), member 1